MADIVNRVHVSPGVYSTDTVDMKAAANSVGVTKLAVVGETLKGPAFQPYWIHSPKEYSSVFGGTSTEKFKGSNYPKYELPYIAKEYLKEGTELCVVKTLGFSGYNAGPAWVITGGKDGDDKKVVIAVLRSRGRYSYNIGYANQKDENGCECNNGNDVITFDVGERLTVVECDEPISYNMDAVSLSEYSSLVSNGANCDSDYSLSGTTDDFGVSATNLGRFTINCIVRPSDSSVDSPTEDDIVKHFSVSLNPNDNDYILNVLGSSNSDGDAPLYVETLYDIAWKENVESGAYNKINNDLSTYDVAYLSDYCGLLPVDGLLKKNEHDLTRSDLGKRFLCSFSVYDISGVEYAEFDYATNLPNGKTFNVADGTIYTVRQIVDNDGKRRFVYSSYSPSSTEALTGDEKIVAEDKLIDSVDKDRKRGSVVYNNEDGLYYRIVNEYIKKGDVTLKTLKTQEIGSYSKRGDYYSLESITSGTSLSGGSVDTIALNVNGYSYFLYEVNYAPSAMTFGVDSEYLAGNKNIYIIDKKIYAEYVIDSTEDYKFRDGWTFDMVSGQSATMHQIVGGRNDVDVYISKEHITSDSLYDNTKTIRVTVTPAKHKGEQNKSSILSGITSDSGYKYIYVPSSYSISQQYSCPDTVCPGKGFIIRHDTTSAYPIRLKTNGREMVATKKLIHRNGDGYYLIESGLTYQFMSHKFTTFTTSIFQTPDNGGILPVTCDLNDYKSSYRYSSTPWIVSNIKGDANNMELNRLFRFHTISDGKSSLTEVKVSIENIKPESGEFDVVVRDYNDTDASPVILESFRKCTMGEGKNSIAYKIGTIDGYYESKSKYITVEINEGSAAENSVPCGFLGYPIPLYDGVPVSYSVNLNVSIPAITYNKSYYQDISKKKQYFGLSDISGYDVDYFTFKGNMATIEDPEFVTHGFHLDSRVDTSSYSTGSNPKLSVDGIYGYKFDSVSINARTSTEKSTPIIDTEANMRGSIFEDVRLRKFTVLFAGGFDGWDEYREERTNTNEYSYTNYKGSMNNNTGVGRNFETLNNASQYGIDGNAINSDYYATLAGVSLLKNPEEIDINLLATPGIDTINNSLLINEVFNVLDERADTFYIVTTPDRYSGDSDYVDDIPDTDDIVDDFKYNEMYSDNAATYYPWVKIEDNGKYIWLPPTRDVVRDFAESDNTNTTMNLAPAGTSRGKVDAIRARKNLKNSESDMLYDANINPVRTYAQNGLVIMGQKTLRKEDDLMNRVDVRRMVLRMRKLVSIGCIGLIFEPYDNSTVKAFKSIISSIMQVFVDNRAIEKWSMEVDDSEEMRDRLELGAVIYIKPIRALEYITLNFVVTNNDVYFND